MGKPRAITAALIYDRGGFLLGPRTLATATWAARFHAESEKSG
jgi:hypothetical protein